MDTGTSPDGSKGHSTNCMFGTVFNIDRRNGLSSIGISSGQGDFQNAKPDGWRKDGQSTGDFLPYNSSNNSTGNAWNETTNTG